MSLITTMPSRCIIADLVYAYMFVHIYIYLFIPFYIFITALLRQHGRTSSRYPHFARYDHDFKMQHHSFGIFVYAYIPYIYIYIYIYAHYNPVQATDAKPFKFNIVEFMRQDMAKGLTNKAKNVASRGYALCRKNAMEHGLSDGDARLEVDIRISHMSYICMYMYICI